MGAFLGWLPKCLYWPFCPGVFIAILAVVAAAVTFWEHPPRWVKAIAIFLFLSLMCAEVWMMSKDRDRNDSDQQAARRAEETNFKEIAQGIETSISESDRNFTATMKGLKASMYTVTGGDSFAYMWFYPAEGDAVNLIVRQSGDYPLRGMTATLIDIGKYNAWYMKQNPPQAGTSFPGEQFYKLGDIQVHGLLQSGRLYLDPSGKETLLVQFVALNGFWNEWISARRVNGKWLQAMRIDWRDLKTDKATGGTEAKDRTIFRRTDAGFPMINGKPEWNQ